MWNLKKTGKRMNAIKITVCATDKADAEKLVIDTNMDDEMACIQVLEGDKEIVLMLCTTGGPSMKRALTMLPYYFNTYTVTVLKLTQL